MSIGVILLIAAASAAAVIYLLTYLPLKAKLFGKTFSPRLLVCKLLAPFTGKERDDSTGFYYYGARYYAPWTGRWLSAGDPGSETLWFFGRDKMGKFNFPEILDGNWCACWPQCPRNRSLK